MNCIVCSIVLNKINWQESQRTNYVNKCTGCLRAEKRDYHKVWRKNNPVKAAAIQKRHRTKVRETDPIKARANNAYSDSHKRSSLMAGDFDLTPQYVLRMMRNATVCPYFGWPLTFSVGKERTLASIDRIDSKRGYTKANVRVISYLANLMKSYASEDELIAFAKGVLKEHGEVEMLGLLGLGAMRSAEKIKHSEDKR
jgi:hypothetical protein